VGLPRGEASRVASGLPVPALLGLARTIGGAEAAGEAEMDREPLPEGEGVSVPQEVAEAEGDALGERGSPPPPPFPPST
jgi:hypothetical protein